MIIVHWSENEQKYWLRDGDEVLWFESALDAQAARRRIEIGAAVKAERDYITAWLLKRPNANYDPTWLAHMIEEGEHLK